MRAFLACSLLSLALTSVIQAENEDWVVSAGYHGHLFPSAIVISSTLKLAEDEEVETTLGDPFGMIGVELTATRRNQPVEVTVTCGGPFFKESTFTGKLPKKGETYYIAPILRYDYDKLYSHRQATPDTVTVTVKLDGELLGTQTERVIVRSINDCLYSYPDENDEIQDCTYMFAAYVNENHPVVQEILAEALQVEDENGDLLIDSISGYQVGPEDVRQQVKAVYLAIQNRGVKYSNIVESSVADDILGAQHVRLLGDSTNQGAANCVDGSVLFCSVMRKMGLNTYLVSVPGHMFMGVSLDENDEEHIEIETTLISNSTFEQAVKAGSRAYRKVESKLDGEDPEYQIIDIELERQDGVIALKDISAERP